METILVAIDGSTISHKALAVACDLARVHGARLLLLHALLRDKEPAELHRLAEVDGAPAELQAALGALEHAPPRELSEEEVLRDHNAVARPVPDAVLRELGTCILHAAGRQAADAGVEAEPLALHEGTAAEGILATARDRGVEAIVLGSRGLRNVEAIAFGSVSQAVGQGAPCTCITVI